MTVEITRKKQYTNSLGKYKLKLNGETIFKIKNGETKTIELNQKDSVLQVRNGLDNSNKLTINKGDRVEVRVKFWTFWYGLLIGGFAGSVARIGPGSVWLSLFFILLIAHIPIFLVPVYTLSKVD